MRFVGGRFDEPALRIAPEESITYRYLLTHASSGVSCEDAVSKRSLTCQQSAVDQFV